jgi:hypothetical protein
MLENSLSRANLVLVLYQSHPIVRQVDVFSYRVGSEVLDYFSEHVIWFSDAHVFVGNHLCDTSRSFLVEQSTYRHRSVTTCEWESHVQNWFTEFVWQ